MMNKDSTDASQARWPTVSEPRSGLRTLLKRNFYARVAREVSRVTRYYDQLIQWHPQSSDEGHLFYAIDCPFKRQLKPEEALPDLSEEKEKRTLILLNGTLNHNFDIQGLLLDFKKRLSRTSRLGVIAYSPYLRGIYAMLSRLGWRSKADQQFTFLTRTDLQNLAQLSGFEVVRMRPCVQFPFHWLGIGTAINAFLSVIPGIRWLGAVHFILLRPIIRSENPPSLSVVIPARNERGNIENALRQFPKLRTDEVEIIYVEGHSSDNTWEEIQRVTEEYKDQFKLKAFQQKGKGKADAVRLGFQHATGDLLTILDADLTTPPELMGRFYNAYADGLGDFVNGNRLIYPMEGKAMRFLNHLGNVFFAKALSTVLDTRLGDSLCGTKLVSRYDYERFKRWRKDFGDFDPFGDFELLFPAAQLGLGLVDIPIRYLDRTYGETNISRFRHGLYLLKMTWVGLIKIRSCRG